MSSVYGAAKQEINSIDGFANAISNTTYKLFTLTRFAVLDTQNNQTFAIQNTNASFFDDALNDNDMTAHNYWKLTALDHDRISPFNVNDSNEASVKAKLANYNSHVILGNSSSSIEPVSFGANGLQIDAIAVGDQFIVADGKLYIID